MIDMEKLKTGKRKSGRPLSFDREAVLQSAMLTFWRYGYETTSISDLTASMGVTAPSLYAAFGDKKGLFLEAVRLYAGQPQDLEQSLQQASTARQAVEQMLLGAAEAFTGETTPRGCLLASATASGSRHSLDVQRAVAEVRGDVMELVRTRIEQDVAAGMLPPATEASALAAMVIGLIQGMSVLARDGASRRLLKDMARTAMQAWPLATAA